MEAPPGSGRVGRSTDQGEKMMNGIKDGYKIDPLGELLRANRYGGRGIVIGKSADGKKAVFAYFIMGRSENSRNRIFLEKGDEVVIHAYDPAKLADPTLIIYSPVKQYRNHTIVTNGDQTDTGYAESDTENQRNPHF